MMHSFTRLGFMAAAAALFGLVSAPAVAAQADEDQRDNVVVLTGRAEIRENESVDHVFIADGPVVVDGTVRDGVVALNGDVLVRGVVEDEVVALDGRVVVADTGQVQGDVLSRHRPVVEGGGRLDGDWERWDPRAWSRASAIFTRVAIWVAFTISTLILGLLLALLAPRAPDAVYEATRARTGAVIGWGLVLAIGLPLAAVLLMATVIGLPLGLGTLFALGLVYGIGYTTGAWVLGRTVAPRRSAIVSFLAGWGILRIVALIPVLGGLSWFAAVVVGLGAIAIAAYRTRSRVPVPTSEEPSPPGPPSPAETAP